MGPLSKPLKFFGSTSEIQIKIIVQFCPQNPNENLRFAVFGSPTHPNGNPGSTQPIMLFEEMDLDLDPDLDTEVPFTTEPFATLSGTLSIASARKVGFAMELKYTDVIHGCRVRYSGPQSFNPY